MMKTVTPGITVNGIKITPDDINAEVQYHPATTLPAARMEAMQALVVRELLLQRAAEMGLCNRDEAIAKADEVIESLLAAEITVPQADQETCLRYYEQNKKKFFTAPLFEVSHILYLAPPGDAPARDAARDRALAAIEKIHRDPSLFPEIAKAESACSSAAQSGMLGQISRGQTMPAFEAALMAMRAGGISREPVETEVGYHVIHLHQRADGQQLSFDAVAAWIADYLYSQSWQRAFHQYVQLLAGRAEISGFRLDMADSPLVQ